MRRPPEPEAFRPPLTALIDIAFLVLIFFMALPLKNLDHKLQANLPREGMEPFTPDQPPPPKVVIRVLQRGERALYRLGDRYFEGTREMEGTLRQLGPGNAYEVYADARCGWQAVVDPVNLLAGLDYEQVRFRGAGVPTATQRRAVPLPLPR